MIRSQILMKFWFAELLVQLELYQYYCSSPCKEPGLPRKKDRVLAGGCVFMRGGKINRSATHTHTTECSSM